MKKVFQISFFLLLIYVMCFGQQSGRNYLLAYFKDKKQDGPRYAISSKGYNWESLENNGHSFSEPMVGKDRLMRDPCIIRGKDGQFHMVWTKV